MTRIARRTREPATPPVAEGRTLIRKTRLMAKAGAMLIRVEVFQDGVLRSTHLRLSTAVSSEAFTDLDQALEAFRALMRRPAEKTRFKTAA